VIRGFTFKGLLKENALTALFLFLTSVFFCMLVYRVYPYTILFPDTYSYYLIGKNLFHPQQIVIDHSRVPLYGAILYFTSLSQHTSALLYWFHALLFCGNVLLAYRIGRLVWNNTRLACVLALLLLLTEVRSMSTLFFSAVALTESLCAHLLFSSTLLLVEGIIRRKRSFIVAACVIASLSTAVRPMIFTLIPLILTVVFPLIRKGRKPWISTILLLLLLIAPEAGWKIRNALAYNTFQSHPFTGLHFLVHGMSLMEDDDNLFNDTQKDAVLRKGIADLALPPPYDAPSPYSHDPHSYWGVVIGFLGSQTPYYKEHRSEIWDETGLYSFQLSDNARKLGLRLITKHPIKYAYNVAAHYLHLFDLSSIEKIAYQEFSRDPRAHYLSAFTWEKTNTLLYPEFLEMPIPVNPAWSDSAALRILTALVFTGKSDQTQPLNPLTVAFPHALFLAALWYWYRHRKGTQHAETSSREVTLLIIVFPVIALYHFTTAAVTNLYDTRYALPVLMLYHFYCLAGVLMIARHINSLRLEHKKHDNDDWYTQTLN